jgi:acyl-CoA reductase-like NAD-dependent aldehyde dehydrogenase
VASEYKLGDPLDEQTTLGPVVSLRSAKTIREHIAEAGQLPQVVTRYAQLTMSMLLVPVSKGARTLIPDSVFEGSAKEGTTYVAPQIVVDVDHSMKIISEETFGPVMGVMKVSVHRKKSRDKMGTEPNPLPSCRSRMMPKLSDL